MATSSYLMGYFKITLLIPGILKKLLYFTKRWFLTCHLFYILSNTFNNFLFRKFFWCILIFDILYTY